MTRSYGGFGGVRQLPSGRWQARYCINGLNRTAGQTFSTRGAAQRFLAQVDLERSRGGWIDPEAGEIKLSAYAEQWLRE
jgi:hypothetical protein